MEDQQMQSILIDTMTRMDVAAGTVIITQSDPCVFTSKQPVATKLTPALSCAAGPRFQTSLYAYTNGPVTVSLPVTRVQCGYEVLRPHGGRLHRLCRRQGRQEL